MSETLRDDNLIPVISTSIDKHKVSDSRADLQVTNDERVVKILNSGVREPRRLLFFHGALFESTVNTNEYSQSQTLIMINVPTQQQTDDKAPLQLYAKPPDGKPLDSSLYDHRQPPTEEYLLSNKWKLVTIKVAPERVVTREHITAVREQYCLRHIAASTVSTISEQFKRQ